VWRIGISNACIHENNQPVGFLGLVLPATGVMIVQAKTTKQNTAKTAKESMEEHNFFR
jgi:hypothetical protein